MFFLRRLVSTTKLPIRTSTSPVLSPGMLDMGSYAYLWRIKDQFLGAPFPECYAGPEFFTLGAGEQRRRLELCEKRRRDEYWYLWRAWWRNFKWDVLVFLGLRPY
ncbi:hypothetical protein PMIN01_05489 [Paraphaeosphaeria minitans]|uniref:Uncharacterized protein n=1 Tax=Paraphaeosphaeria minitans TaxID=565426 RepID=A0A9P6KSY3_9PLEO|nr:hypothetical protein PMIN01_05489 [Paraphaeosphaeria minitans]